MPNLFRNVRQSVQVTLSTHDLCGVSVEMGVRISQNRVSVLSNGTHCEQSSNVCNVPRNVVLEHQLRRDMLYKNFMFFGLFDKFHFDSCNIEKNVITDE